MLSEYVKGLEAALQACKAQEEIHTRCLESAESEQNKQVHRSAMCSAAMCAHSIRILIRQSVSPADTSADASLAKLGSE